MRKRLGPVVWAKVARGAIPLSRQALPISFAMLSRLLSGGSVLIAVDGVEVVVRDQGNGVPEDIKTQLFQPFVTGKTRGLGLGLAVAKRCLRRQEGTSCSIKPVLMAVRSVWSGEQTRAKRQAEAKRRSRPWWCSPVPRRRAGLESPKRSLRMGT